MNVPDDDGARRDENAATSFADICDVGILREASCIPSARSAGTRFLWIFRASCVFRPHSSGESTWRTFSRAPVEDDSASSRKSTTAMPSSTSSTISASTLNRRPSRTHRTRPIFPRDPCDSVHPLRRREANVYPPRAKTPNPYRPASYRQALGQRKMKDERGRALHANAALRQRHRDEPGGADSRELESAQVANRSKLTRIHLPPRSSDSFWVSKAWRCTTTSFSPRGAERARASYRKTRSSGSLGASFEASTALSALQDYIYGGGRAFATHFHYSKESPAPRRGSSAVR